MKANLKKIEPKILETWEKNDVYSRLMQKNEGKPLFILHDGPPYANGNIHLGTVLNKILKDFIVRYKNIAGFKAPFTPGWDAHGLPIELKARRNIQEDSPRKLSSVGLRKTCENFALEQIENQKNQFKRVGILGDWNHPYITLQKEYEATQIEVFSGMVFKGYIYRGLRPVHWCTECKTALAEAEIEYKNSSCYSIFVKFLIKEDFSRIKKMGADLSRTYFIIWTTTTWTLPGNVAVSVSNVDYALVKVKDEFYIIAKDLYKTCLESIGINEYELFGTINGKQLEYMTVHHPLFDKESLVVMSSYITLDVGTGCVHTAPGHGMEDFLVCKNYKDLKILVPVDSNGNLTSEAGEFEGFFVKGYENTELDAGRVIAASLKRKNLILATKKIRHKYPHCWRCKEQVIFRATEQWFCSVEKFRDLVVKEAKKVKFTPTWGKDRIISMIKDRKDWCISRQRKWGVPIPVFYCKNCKEPFVSQEIMDIIAQMFRKFGSNSWFETDTSEILKDKGFKCSKCLHKEFIKETDVMDVWFDSGTSHASVCKKRKELSWPADLYLEGLDQYRGWFQSSLLTSVAVFNKSPYKHVVAHGWVVDGKGEKMSKSLGNGMNPEEIINLYGADILRLWVASSDYQADVRISDKILKQLTESYRKIRNTIRFMLGNLYDFDPDKDKINLKELESIDKFIIAKFNLVLKEVHKGYENYEFHRVYHAVYNFCVVDMSNFYLDIMKDRLYVELAFSKTRRAAQTVMYVILNSLVFALSPIIPYTSDEVFGFMPHSSNINTKNIIFNDIPVEIIVDFSENLFDYWNKIQEIQKKIRKVLEIKRKAKEIGSSLEAKIILKCSGELYGFLANAKDDLRTALIVSYVEIVNSSFSGAELTIEVEHADGRKCARCWNYSKTVGNNAKNGDICKRCVDILSNFSRRTVNNKTVS
jgi:isoleucyl-tRNA synthetase